MWTRVAATVVFGVWVCGAVAQQPGKDGPRSQPEAKSPAQPSLAQPLTSGGRPTIFNQAQKRPELTATSRMVLVRFVIAQVTLRGGPSAPDKPATASRPANGAAPAKSPIVAMPEQTLFDAELLNKQLQAAPLDLRTDGGKIGQRLAGLMPDRTVEVITRGQLVTLDAQAAFVQLGQREPRIVGTQMSHMGRANMTSMENVGLIAAITPYVHDQGRISLQINIEKSQLGSPDDGTVIAELPNGEKVRTPEVQSMVVQTTVALVPGRPLALAGVSTHLASRRTEFLVLVSADILDRN